MPDTNEEVSLIGSITTVVGIIVFSGYNQVTPQVMRGGSQLVLLAVLILVDPLTGQLQVPKKPEQVLYMNTLKKLHST